MRVLHAYKVFGPGSYGGVAEAISALVVGMGAKSPARILVARSSFGGHQEFTIDGATVRCVASLGNLFSMPLAPSFPFALARAAATVDVVAAHAPFPLNDVGISLGLPPRVALVIHWHSEIVGRRALAPLVAPFIRRTLERADCIVVSDASMIATSSSLVPVAAKCTVVPFGIDVEYWATLTDAERIEVGQLRLANPRLVMATGRLVSYKGFSVLVEALRHCGAHVVIAGQGPLHEDLQRLARQRGVANRLTLIGNLSRSRLKLFLNAARAFVFPSISSAETFGIAQLEAMAAGLPIVNTALPTGVPNVARDGREAITVPVGDPKALAQAIDRLLADPELAARLGAAGRNRAIAHFHRSRYAADMRMVYAEAVAARLRSIGGAGSHVT